MFEMILFVCAMSALGAVDYCIQQVDTSKVYQTEEECNTRSQYITDLIRTNPDLISYYSWYLGDVQRLGIKGECKDVSNSYI